MGITTEQLRAVPLLASLKDKELRSLVKRMHEKQYSDGDVIVEEGSGGIGFSVILEGTAGVSIGGVTRNQLKAGDHFGELALLDPDTGRQATVTATSDMTCASITAWEFRPLLRENPDMAWEIMRKMARWLSRAEEFHRSAAAA